MCLELSLIKMLVVNIYKQICLTPCFTCDSDGDDDDDDDKTNLLPVYIINYHLMLLLRDVDVNFLHVLKNAAKQ